MLIVWFELSGLLFGFDGLGFVNFIMVFALFAGLLFVLAAVVLLRC